MKKLLVLMVVVLMMASFALAADGGQKQETISVNVNVLPHSVLTVPEDAIFDFTFDPENHVDYNPMNPETWWIAEVDIVVESNYVASISVTYDIPDEFRKDHSVNIFCTDEGYDFNQAYNNHIGRKNYTIRLFMQPNYDWYEIAEGNYSGTVTVTVAGFVG